MSASAWELPSGKTAGSENFPVASRLVREDVRADLMVFYDFCRAIDDIADAPAVSAAERRWRLEAYDAVLAGVRDDGPPKALALRRALEARRLDTDHGRELIAAFILDTEKHRYRDWHELRAYCRLSATPVGRQILDLHGEDRGTWPASDALCDALQVINHLQDCGDDYRELDRVYLPEPWLAEQGLRVDVLAGPLVPAGLRRVLDDLLDRTTGLLNESRHLSSQVKDWRLALEIGAIQSLAERLVAELRHRDPLAERVKLPRRAMAVVGLRGALRAGGRRWLRRR